MSQAIDDRAPALFHTAFQGPAASTSLPHRTARKPPRPGQRAVMLSAWNDLGASVVLVFAPARGGIAFWRSLAPGKAPVRFVTTFPGRFTPLAVAHLLASGQARPSLEPKLAHDCEIEGVDPRDAALLRLAWCRTDERPDSLVDVALALPKGILEQAEERMGHDPGNGLLELCSFVREHDAAWLARWGAEIDAEVDRRGAGAGEARRRALRAFVERCLVTVGRLPRPDESEERWDGQVLGRRKGGPAIRRKLGLLRPGRSGRFRVWVAFWTAAETYGLPDVSPGPGWYWDVSNPDPAWVMSVTMGPYRTPEEAWEEAGHLEDPDE
jgi:hypothetical protein